jgi:hypothetical protein
MSLPSPTSVFEFWRDVVTRLPNSEEKLFKELEDTVGLSDTMQAELMAHFWCIRHGRAPQDWLAQRLPANTSPPEWPSNWCPFLLANVDDAMRGSIAFTWVQSAPFAGHTQDRIGRHDGLESILAAAHRLEKWPKTFELGACWPHNVRLAGESYNLSALIAGLSELIRQPIPRDLAATGIFDGQAFIPVPAETLPSKLHVAQAWCFKRLFVVQGQNGLDRWKADGGQVVKVPANLRPAISTLLATIWPNCPAERYYQDALYDASRPEGVVTSDLFGRHYFVGRSVDAHAVRRWLEDRKDNRIFWLCGPGGRGKTTLACRVLRECSFPWTSATIKEGVSSVAEFDQDVARRLTHALHVNDPLPSISNVVRHVSTARADGRDVAVLVDGLDSPKKEILGRLADLASAGVKILVTSQVEHAPNEEIPLISWVVKPLTRSDIEQCLLSVLAEMDKSRSRDLLIAFARHHGSVHDNPFQFFVDHVMRNTAGLPRKLAATAAKIKARNFDPQSLASDDDYDPKLFHARHDPYLLLVIARLREPVSFARLETLLSHIDPDFSPENLRSRLSASAGVVGSRWYGGEVCYELADTRYRTLIYDILNPETNRVRRIDNALCAWCEKGIEVKDGYALKHYAEHLKDAQHYSKLYIIAVDEDFAEILEESFASNRILQRRPLDTAIEAAIENGHLAQVIEFCARRSIETAIDVQTTEVFDILRDQGPSSAWGAVKRIFADNKNPHVRSADVRKLWALMIVLHPFARGDPDCVQVLFNAFRNRENFSVLRGTFASCAMALMPEVLNTVPLADAEEAQNLVEAFSQSIPSEDWPHLAMFLVRHGKRRLVEVLLDQIRVSEQASEKQSVAARKVRITLIRKVAREFARNPRRAAVADRLTEAWNWIDRVKNEMGDPQQWAWGVVDIVEACVFQHHDDPDYMADAFRAKKHLREMDRAAAPEDRLLEQAIVAEAAFLVGMAGGRLTEQTLQEAFAGLFDEIDADVANLFRYTRYKIPNLRARVAAAAAMAGLADLAHKQFQRAWVETADEQLKLRDRDLARLIGMNRIVYHMRHAVNHGAVGINVNVKLEQVEACLRVLVQSGRLNASSPHTPMKIDEIRGNLARGWADAGEAVRAAQALRLFTRQYPHVEGSYLESLSECAAILVKKGLDYSPILERREHVALRIIPRVAQFLSDCGRTQDAIDIIAGHLTASARRDRAVYWGPVETRSTLRAILYRHDHNACNPPVGNRRTTAKQLDAVRLLRLAGLNDQANAAAESIPALARQELEQKRAQMALLAASQLHHMGYFVAAAAIFADGKYCFQQMHDLGDLRPRMALGGELIEHLAKSDDAVSCREVLSQVAQVVADRTISDELLRPSCAAALPMLARGAIYIPDLRDAIEHVVNEAAARLGKNRILDRVKATLMAARGVFPEAHRHAARLDPANRNAAQADIAHGMLIAGHTEKALDVAVTISEGKRLKQFIGALAEAKHLCDEEKLRYLLRLTPHAMQYMDASSRLLCKLLELGKFDGPTLSKLLEVLMRLDPKLSQEDDKEEHESVSA